ncbi:Predicted Zn-dependent peptidase [Celeribacter baekdonensis]|uniref:Predicted Zn-dependent peptidase n=1 Tax=Celeribacter baekdonensis TaxID=875171 RepID=A0A1G7HNP4_9RHOB|nr:pitrilysin family protein [Celeribacter baekdonensis]MBU2079193.1 insulinase family protein [Alphaproteobacteria bacterium]MBU2159618.1 insulinase family protein [Alphaproteobacteria bacterium]MBU2243787.1 insulinase family protein [Alphaproteobacteria bacterium]SDF02065.1 Predicted Zn-dependent peptidase [Celeribacter baekdonensis]
MSPRTHTLPNGFRIVTELQPSMQSASIGVWVMAGGRHERVEQNGIAHFLEHMAFKGTERRTPLQIAEVLENVGGYLNAYTSREVTAYYARVLKDDVSLALDVIGDIVLNPIFDPRELEVERGVILSEIGQALDTPDDVVFDWLQEATFPKQALGRTILGPAERVRAFSRDDLAGFVEEHYSPERMVLSAAGNIDHDRIVEEATEIFGGLTSHGRDHADPARFEGGEFRKVKKLEQAHFTLAFEGPGYRDEDIYIAQTATTALGGGMSSRLFQELREKRGLCYTIYAQSGAYADTGMTTIYAGTSGDQVGELAALTIDEMKRAADEMTLVEVDRARAQIKAGLLMGMESPSSRAERNARMIGIWGRVPAVEETVKRIDAVTLDGVRDFLAKIGTSRASMALYGPVKGAPDLADLRERFAA